MKKVEIVTFFGLAIGLTTKTWTGFGGPQRKTSTWGVIKFHQTWETLNLTKTLRFHDMVMQKRTTPETR